MFYTTFGFYKREVLSPDMVDRDRRIGLRPLYFIAPRVADRGSNGRDESEFLIHLIEPSIEFEEKIAACWCKERFY